MITDKRIRCQCGQGNGAVVSNTKEGYEQKIARIAQKNLRYLARTESIASLTLSIEKGFSKNISAPFSIATSCAVL